MKILTFFTFVIALFCSTFSLANAQGYSGNHLMVSCSSDQEGIRSMCPMYILGAIDGLRTGVGSAAVQAGAVELEAFVDRSNSMLGACIPEQATVNRNQLYAVALAYLENHPERWHEPAVFLIHSALKDAFPCE